MRYRVMVMLKVQDHLRGGGTVAGLTERYAIMAKRHRQYSNLVLFKYNQVASPMHDPIVQECRGLVLDESNDWAVVAWPFSKFFNASEGLAATIEWASARVQEKVDGSLITLYWYGDQWHVATTGTPDAGGPVDGASAAGNGRWEAAPGCWLPVPASFADYFWQVFSFYANGVDRATYDVPRHVCFMFELTGSLNRVVVQHHRARLTLLGARDMQTGAECHPTIANRMLGYGFPVVKEYPLTSMADIMATFGAMRPLEQEGYVVVDAHFNRVKVKHPGYVALHHAKDGLSTRAFVEIARTGEVPEAVAVWPELTPRLEDARSRLDALVASVEADYAAHRNIAVQKDFAMAVKRTRCPAALFSVRAGKAASVRDYFATTSLDVVMRLLGYKEST